MQIVVDEASLIHSLNHLLHGGVIQMHSLISVTNERKESIDLGK